MHFLVMSLSPLKVSETFSDDSKINEAERTPISFLSLWFMLCCYSGKNSPTWEMKKWILISSTGWTSTKIGFSIKKFDVERSITFFCFLATEFWEIFCQVLHDVRRSYCVQNWASTTIFCTPTYFQIKVTWNWWE